MTAHYANYGAYLLRIWQEPAEERASPTRYFLLEQLFDARQRWLFTDPAELQTHLHNIIALPTIAQSVSRSNEPSQTSSDTPCSINEEFSFSPNKEAS